MQQTEALVKPAGLVNVQTAASAIFQPKPQDGLYVCSGFLDVYPMNGTTRGNQGGTFQLEPTQKVQDPTDILIIASLRIYNKLTSAHLDENSLVWPINGCLSSLFKTLKISIGGKIVTNHDSNYAMINYLQTLTGFSDESRECVKDNEGWHRDTPFAFDSFACGDDGFLLNQGAWDRLARFALPKNIPAEKDAQGKITKAGYCTVDWESTNGTGFFVGRLTSDFSSLDFGIVPSAPVKIEFTTNPANFYLMAHPSAVTHKQVPEVEIVSIQLKVMSRVLPPDNYEAIMRPLANSKKSQQTFLQMRINSQDVRIGGLSWSQDNFMGGEVIGKENSIDAKHIRCITT